MADPIPHTLNEANGHIAASGAGKPLPIARFGHKSMILSIANAGDYTVQVSNDITFPAARTIVVAANLVAGASPHLITTEEGATPRFPDKIAFMRIVTNVQDAATQGDFLGEDHH